MELSVLLRSIMIFSAITAASMSVSCVDSADKAVFDQSLVMVSAGQYDQALPLLTGLCMKHPEDPNFCVQEKNLKNSMFDSEIAKAKEKLAAKAPVSVGDLDYASQRVERAKAYGVRLDESAAVEADIAAQKNFTEEHVKAVIAQAELDIKEGRKLQAYATLKETEKLDPARLKPVVSAKGDEIFTYYMAEIESKKARDEWAGVEKTLENLLTIKPDSQQAKDLLAEAKEKGKAVYFIKKAEEKKEEGDFEGALDYYTKALAFPGVTSETAAQISRTRVQLAEHYYTVGVEYVQQELYRQAYLKFKRAAELLDKVSPADRESVNVPAGDLDYYYNNLFFLGSKAEEAGRIGAAYLFYKMISDLSPDYPDVKLKLKDMETAILARAQKSIAVIPFKTAGVAEDMGTIITSNIMFSLLRQMSTEIRIIERSDIDILLREYELAVAGNMTENSGETGSFEIKSADYLLMGDVLDSRTETNIQNSRKKVRVQTGEKKVHSIEYEDWAVKYEKLQAEGQKVPPAPEKYVMEPVMEDVEYDVSYHSKVSYLNVSYRIVETSQGKVIYNNSSQAQKEARDEASGGVELGAYKIPMKVAALPTDIELSNQVRNEVIDKIVSDIKGIFKDPEQKYFLEAQKLETEGNIHGAIEKYADTILIRKVKSIDTSEMEEKVGKYLDVYGSI